MKRHAALVPLSRQHHDGLALGVFIERGLRGDAEAGAARRLRQQALDAFEVEFRGHFDVEERILFPAVRAALADPALIDQLLAEHEELRAAFASLEQAGDEDSTDALLDLRERLVRHIRTEEQVLFQAIQESLAEKELSALGKRIEEMLATVCAVHGLSRA